MEGIIILIITLLAFAGVAAFFIINAIKGPDIPKGIKFVHVHAGNKAIVVFESDIQNKDKKEFIVNGETFSGEEVAKACAYAMTATEQAFAQKGIDKANVKTTVFLFKTDAAFEKGGAWWSVWSKSVAAYTVDTGAAFGKGYPMAVIRSKYIKTVAERGQPACHEMIHVLNMKAQGNYEHNHGDKRLWEKYGSDTVEIIATNIWKSL